MSQALSIVQGTAGLSESLSGVVERRSAFEGSKSARGQVFLVVKDGLVPVVLKGDNPFTNAGLLGLLNQNVTCVGTWQANMFVIQEVVEQSTVSVETKMETSDQLIEPVIDTPNTEETPVEEASSEEESSEEPITK